MTELDDTLDLPAAELHRDPRPTPLSPLLYEPLVRATITDDLGRGGDITTDAVIPMGTVAEAQIVSRQDGRISGLEVALAAFRVLDPGVVLVRHVVDGDRVEAGDVLATIGGQARALLTAERTALNLLGRMCGIATVTGAAAEAARLSSPHARVCCTRKTTPGLRVLEKYAVRCGGGVNHRFGLDDGVLIKDNHIALAGGIEAAITRAKAAVGHMVKIEVEVDTLDQLREVLDLGADAVLLDNMDLTTLTQAVALVDGRLVTEASGGITPDRVADVAGTGVDLLSLGWLTHSAKTLDVALDIEPV
ncbi:MAG: carboxylating nicotinate-nucleotide diphosphorylase [Rhodospirillaceae bacterium]|nr:carboxylating nicotinate-nucleotide diphosphorylase [Rhodospirillaceae bacterium]